MHISDTYQDQPRRLVIFQGLGFPLCIDSRLTGNAAPGDVLLFCRREIWLARQARGRYQRGALKKTHLPKRAASALCMHSRLDGGRTTR